MHDKHSIDNLKDGTFLSIELSPSLNKHIDEYLTNEDFINICPNINHIIVTDSPLGKYTHNPILSSVYIKQQTNIKTIATFAMRDKNTPYALAEIRTAEALGLDSYMFLTGDKTKDGKNVFEKSSTEFMREVCIQKKKNGLKTLMYTTCSNNLTENVKKKIKKKIMNGGDVVVTQPITSYEEATQLKLYFEQLKNENIVDRDFHLVIGFFPIIKFSTAKFLRDNVPGAAVSDILYDLLKNGKEEEAFLYNKTIYDNLIDNNYNVHLMTANNFKTMKRFIF
jgi:5,10-methylenetetrahydrofolate reductase